MLIVLALRLVIDNEKVPWGFGSSSRSIAKLISMTSYVFQLTYILLHSKLLQLLCLSKVIPIFYINFMLLVN